MKNLRATRLLAVMLTGTLFHYQLALAAGCDVPMFGGARLFRAVNGSTVMATADFNQDGFTDLVLGGTYTDAAGRPGKGISVQLSNGDGTFQPPVYYSFAPNDPSDVLVADFNGDGKPDVAVAANSSIVVMLGNGDGTFKAGLRTAVSANLMAVGDFNGDGKPDLVLSGNISVLLGKGDGTFQAPILAATGSSIPSGRVAVGDFNGDGKLDVVAPSVSGTILTMLGDGTGKLGAPVIVSIGETFPGKLAVGDLNGDRTLDVVSINSINNHISVLLGNGNGSFQPATTYNLGGVGDTAFGVMIADLTGDGIPDLAVANITSTTAVGSTISVFSGTGDGTFGPPVQYNPVAQPIWVMAAGDFNGDGLTDLVFTSSADVFPTQVGVIFGAADGTLQSPRRYAVGPFPGQPVLADLNGDGVLDLVEPAAIGTNGNLSVLLGNGDGSFQPAVSYPAAVGAHFVAVGDFNGDGKPDLAASNLSGLGFNLLVFLGNGDGTFGAPVVTSVMNEALLVVGDFNKDGKLDVIVGGQILFGNGDGTFRVTFNFVQASLVADLNGDGNLDLVAAGTNTVLVQLGNGDGTFRAPVRYTVRNTAVLALGDLNGDGKPDIVAIAEPFVRGAANQVLSGNIAVLLNNGDGTFQAAVRYAVAPNLSAVAVGDFNGDGNMDVAVSSASAPVGAVTVLLGNGDGTFRNALTYGGGTPTAMAVGDLNGDGKPDLAMTGGLGDSVVVLLNTYVSGSGGSACAPVPVVAN